MHYSDFVTIFTFSEEIVAFYRFMLFFGLLKTAKVYIDHFFANKNILMPIVV